MLVGLTPFNAKLAGGAPRASLLSGGWERSFHRGKTRGARACSTSQPTSMERIHGLGVERFGCPITDVLMTATNPPLRTAPGGRAHCFGTEPSSEFDKAPP